MTGIKKGWQATLKIVQRTLRGKVLLIESNTLKN